MREIPLYFSKNVEAKTRSFYRQTLGLYGPLRPEEYPPEREGKFLMIEGNSRVLFDPLSLQSSGENIRLSSYDPREDRVREEPLMFSTFPPGPLRPSLCALDLEKIHRGQPVGCLFLDRDGIIIEDTGYPKNPETLLFKEEIVPVIKGAKARGLTIMVVSNQSGLARGYLDHQDVEACWGKIQEKLKARGTSIDHHTYCPHHPQGIREEYRRISPARKPSPGMILTAFAHAPLDLGKSLMVGDRESDRIHLGGLKSLIVTPDFKAQDILAHLPS